MGKVIDKYIEENRDFVTASKLKTFIKSPEQFFLQYIKEVEPLDKREKKHFILGEALDDLISYGENTFYKKYYFDEGLLKADLEEKLFNMWVETKGLKVDEMKEVYYGDTSTKIRLTAWDKEVVLWCYNELKRQPLFNINWWYTAQQTFTCKYKNLKLKWTLDRYKKDEIRDTKSTADINKFIWTWKDLGYDVSMSFYWILVWKATGDKSKLLLDVVQKTFPHPSRIYEIPQGDIVQTVETTIIPALDTLDAMLTAWNETKDENVWKVKTEFQKIATCDLFPIMETAIQEEIEILQ